MSENYHGVSVRSETTMTDDLTAPERIWARGFSEKPSEKQWLGISLLGGVEYVRADRIAVLEAALADMMQQRDAAMAGAVNVKPIVFNKLGAEWWGSADFGIYVVAEVDTDAGRMWAFWQPDADEDYVDEASDFYHDERSALAAAQADYEARILSALTPDPDRLMALTAAAEAQAEARGMRICANIYYERCCTVIDGDDVYRQMIASADETEAVAKSEA